MFGSEKVLREKNAIDNDFLVFGFTIKKKYD